ncbi:ubiquinone anaerobic biosynthesis accessory factor UbiT [Thiohalorhabdus sp. Cl-TMA]|uniref:SCP2 domain-containing protein n=1 Tax=Thiohalorhabdus methylotrophus TaxID=3242694 RepID=A0ABV4TRU8_9GAMM
MTDFPHPPVLVGAFRLHLRCCPDCLHSAALSRVWNHVVAGQAFGRRMRDLEGNRIAVEVTETGNAWSFQVRAPRLHPIRGECGWDVRVRGRAEDLLRLALGMEDADTLFFNRRLCMEGDTATGLYLKNLLDALEVDWEAHSRAITMTLPGPLRKSAREILRRVRPEQRLAALRRLLPRNRLVNGTGYETQRSWTGQGSYQETG